MKVTEYVVSAEHTIQCGPMDTLIITPGMFVKPIELTYVPKHVKDDPRWSLFDKKVDIFCYGSFGIVPIPRSKIRST